MLTAAGQGLTKIIDPMLAHRGPKSHITTVQMLSKNFILSGIFIDTGLIHTIYNIILVIISIHDRKWLNFTHFGTWCETIVTFRPASSRS